MCSVELVGSPICVSDLYLPFFVYILRFIAKKKIIIIISFTEICVVLFS